MTQRYIGQDIGGFGRLAKIEMEKRREERLDKDAALRHRLSEIQIKQAEMNLSSIQKEEQIKKDLTKVINDLPEGETRFTASHKYLLRNGLFGHLKKLEEAESKRIEEIRKTGGSQAAADAYNGGLGSVYDTKITPILSKNDVYSTTGKDGKTIFFQLTSGKFKLVDAPDITNIHSEKPKGVALKDKNLEVINALAAKVQDGTATEAEIRTYILAEHDYTKVQIYKDPNTGGIYTQAATLPPGFPSLKNHEVGDAAATYGDLSPGQEEKVLNGMTIKQVKKGYPVTQAQMADYQKAAQEINYMLVDLKKLTEDVRKKGTRNVSLTDMSRRSSQYSTIMTRYKEVLNLGVLQGDDLTLMEKIIKPPVGVGAMLLGRKYVLASYDNTIETLNRNLNTLNEITGGVVKGAEPSEQDKMDFLDKRGAELLKQGMSKEEAYKQAKKEMTEKFK